MADTLRERLTKHLIEYWYGSDHPAFDGDKSEAATLEFVRAERRRFAERALRHFVGSCDEINSYDMSCQETDAIAAAEAEE